MEVQQKQLEIVSVRLVKDSAVMSEKPIFSPYDAIKLIGEKLCELDREVLCVINLRGDNVPINCNFVSVGAVNQCMAHPREILKSSILSNAASMILLHNHPSGKLEPSKYDTMITDRMLQLCDQIGIPLVDHIIVGGNNTEFFSFYDKNLLRFEDVKYETDYRKLDSSRFYVAENQDNNFVKRRHGR